MRKGLQIELYRTDIDEGETTDVAGQYPEVVEKIKGFIIEAYSPNPYRSKDNRPLLNLERACRDNGVSKTQRP